MNLAVVASCGEQRVRNLMTNIKEISYFFNLSVPRKNCLEDKILLYCPESLKHKLKDVCRTRWVERIEGMDVFEELFVPVYYSLLVMKENNDTVHYNNETSAKAESLFKLVDDFEFIVTLVVTRSILDYLLPVTRKLQTKDLDVAQSMDLIQNLKLTISNLRNSVENYHENCYNKAKKPAEKVDISQANIIKPRTCSRQIYQSNQPVQNTKEYFRVSLTIPFLDHVSADLEYRFPGDELTQYRGLHIIPYVMLNESSDWKKEFMVFANYYYEDFPNFNGLDAELDLWFNFWDCAKFKNNLPDSVSVTLKRVDSLAFPNIHLALKLLGTLPITTCECERSF